MDEISIKSETSDISDSDGTESWEPGENEANSERQLKDSSETRYGFEYESFMNWKCTETGVDDDFISEELILKYFESLAQKYKPSFLWNVYNSLHSTLYTKHNINIENYFNLYQFVREKCRSYLGKKDTFTLAEIHKFLNEAPDQKYLPMKVALIMGAMGACNATQLHTLKIEDVQDIGTGLLVSLPFKNNKKVVQKFKVAGKYYEICKKYINLRPDDCLYSSFFLLYVDGKCLPQNIGINKLGTFGKQIAMYLKLPNPKLYTGHCFRRCYGSLKSEYDPAEDDDIFLVKTEQIDKFVSDAEAIKIVQLAEPNKNYEIRSEPAATLPRNPQEKEKKCNINATRRLRIENSDNITINFFINKKDKKC